MKPRPLIVAFRVFLFLQLLWFSYHVSYDVFESLRQLTESNDASSEASTTP